MKALASIPNAHTDSVLCCTIHMPRKLLLSGGEDACLCFADLSSNKHLGRLTTSEGEAITSVVCSPADEHTAFASAGRAAFRLDLRKGLDETSVVETIKVNQDEINGLAIDASGCWLAAADDNCEVQVVAVGGPATSASGRPLYKTLRRGHGNLASSVTFRPSRPTEVVSGGLDCRVVRWDFQKLRQLHTWDMNNETMVSNGQICNPPMVHCVTAPDAAAEAPYNRLIAAARGDGCVVLYDGDFRPPAQVSGKGKQAARSGKSDASSSKGGDSGRGDEEKPDTGLRWAAGGEQGGHTAAVNCVCFLPGTSGKALVSAGNDGKLCLWNWEAGVEPTAVLKHRAKINWVCCAAEQVLGMDAVLADVKGRIVAVSLPS